LAEFQEWAESDRFPQRGRIDYIAGSIEVEMSPEDLYCHGTLTSELHAVVGTRVKRTRRGQTFVKQTRLVSPAGDLSVEPDILYVSFESLRSGRVVRRPKANDAERFIAFEGAADLAIEAVSDSSVGKDTKRLPLLYYRANVSEFWLVDARGENLLFEIYHRGPTAFGPASKDAEGYQYSAVLDCWYRLERYRDEVGDWAYELKEKPIS
jgi:Uma2 family endonuclease